MTGTQPAARKGRTQDRQSALARWSLGIGAAVAASIGALALPCAALATGGDQLEQTCVKAALKKPKIVKAAVKHAGRYAGRDQNVVLVVRYEAMPEECRDGYYRGNSAKAQVLSHGNWTYITNWLGLWGAPIRYEGDHSVTEDQEAFTGRFEGLPFSHLTPRRFDPCRVRVLLKENVTHPEHHEYPDSGYHPPDFSNNIAHRIYKINVPVSHVWPHRGSACNLLVPQRLARTARATSTTGFASSWAVASGTKPDCMSKLLRPPSVEEALLERAGYTGAESLLVKARYNSVPGCDNWQRLGKYRTQVKRSGHWLNREGGPWWIPTTPRQSNEALTASFGGSGGKYVDRCVNGRREPVRVQLRNFMRNRATGKVVAAGKIKNWRVTIDKDSAKPC